MIGPTLAPGLIRQGILAQFSKVAPPEGFVETRLGIWNQPKVTTSIARESINYETGLAAMSPQYTEISLPTFVAMQADNPARRETGERLKRDIPGTELVLLRETGHYVQIQKVDDVVALIRKAAESSPASPETAPAEEVPPEPAGD